MTTWGKKNLWEKIGRNLISDQNIHNLPEWSLWFRVVIEWMNVSLSCHRHVSFMAVRLESVRISLNDQRWCQKMLCCWEFHKWWRSESVLSFISRMNPFKSMVLKTPRRFLIWSISLTSSDETDWVIGLSSTWFSCWSAVWYAGEMNLIQPFDHVRFCTPWSAIINSDHDRLHEWIDYDLRTWVESVNFTRFIQSSYIGHIKLFFACSSLVISDGHERDLFPHELLWVVLLWFFGDKDPPDHQHDRDQYVEDHRRHPGMSSLLLLLDRRRPRHFPSEIECVEVRKILTSITWFIPSYPLIQVILQYIWGAMKRVRKPLKKLLERKS